ncbi:MAG: hypothetical protein WDN24_18340 [Sphingomonas sp.]
MITPFACNVRSASRTATRAHPEILGEARFGAEKLSRLYAALEQRLPHLSDDVLGQGHPAPGAGLFRTARLRETPAGLGPTRSSGLASRGARQIRRSPEQFAPPVHRNGFGKGLCAFIIYVYIYNFEADRTHAANVRGNIECRITEWIR